MEFTNILLEKFTTNVGMQCPLPLMDKTTVESDYFCSLPLTGSPVVEVENSYDISDFHWPFSQCILYVCVLRKLSHQVSLPI
jgi:hypothetical protein